MINKIFTNKLSLIGLLMIALLFILAAMAQFIAPHGPDVQHLTKRLEGPSFQYLLGTDDLGRDTECGYL
jgi:ABC-type antimicrobial peptide transport system permease subunit